jgi:hypothetical protein
VQRTFAPDDPVLGVRELPGVEFAGREVVMKGNGAEYRPGIEGRHENAQRCGRQEKKHEQDALVCRMHLSLGSQRGQIEIIGPFGLRQRFFAEGFAL